MLQSCKSLVEEADFLCFRELNDGPVLYWNFRFTGHVGDDEALAMAPDRTLELTVPA